MISSGDQRRGGTILLDGRPLALRLVILGPGLVGGRADVLEEVGVCAEDTGSLGIAVGPRVGA